MHTATPLETPNDSALQFDLGTFEGFNFRSQSAIDRTLTAAEVVAWDHDRQGEAEFWPAGDHPEVALVFQHRTSVSAAELIQLDRLLGELGDDSAVTFLRVHYAVNVGGADLAALSRDAIEDQHVDVFLGTSFIDLRREAAFELFELYYPEEYRVWEKSLCDGLIFDPDRFLDSPSFWVEELTLADEKALLVVAQ